MKGNALKHWFVNSFWYHYKWYAIGGALAAAFVFFFVWELTHKEVPDVNFAVVVDASAGESQLDEMDQMAREIIGDRNGDGKTIVYKTLLSFGNPSLEVANRQRLPILFIDDSCPLLFVDQTTLDNFDEAVWRESFIPWADVGLPGAPDTLVALDVSGWPVFARAELTDEPLYACLKRFDEKKLAKPETARLWEAGAAFVKALMEMNQP